MAHLEQKIRSVLILQPRGGEYAELIAYFRDHDVLGKAVRHAGALSAEVHLPVSGMGPVVVTAMWDTPAAYHGWLSHPVREEMGPAMQGLIEDGPPPTIASGVYEVVISAGGE
jgi:hypothetical protein